MRIRRSESVSVLLFLFVPQIIKKANNNFMINFLY